MRSIDRRTMLSAIAAAALTTTCRGPAARAYPALSKMPAGPVPAPLDYPDFEVDVAPLATTVVFDDFTGAANSAPDVALWQVDTVNQGGTQTYTTNPANVRLDGQSHLVIQAIRDSSGNWTSGHLTSHQRFNMGYGRTEASIQFPEGNGLLPAFWMRGINYPNAAEVDLIELPGNGNTYYIATRQDAVAWDGVGIGGSIGVNLCADFHTYWCNRTPGRIQLGIDNQTLADWNPAALYAGNAAGSSPVTGQSPPPPLPAGLWTLWEQPMFAIMNVAVNTGWGPDADSTTPSPSTMLVDWFRFTPS
jgi:beta-glucanase (GH16 family)